jgi:hypothetical protein
MLSWVAACSADGGGKPPSISRDSAGIRIVESSSPVWPAGEGWRLDDQPTLLIGSVDGPAATQFTDVQGIVRLSDGRIVIANGRNQELRCFSPSGSHMWTAGRAGKGPGDFVRLAAISLYRGDSILAFDFGLQRYSVFDADGRFARSWSPEVPEEVDFYRNLALQGVWADGSIALRHSPVRRGKSPPEVTRRPLRLFRYSPDGRLLGRIGTFTGDEWYEGEGFGISRLPFGRGTRFAMLHDGVIVGTDDTYELRHVRMDGSIATIIRRPQALRPLLPDVARAELKRLQSTRSKERPRMFRGMPDSILAWMAASDDRMFSTMQLPSTYPAYGRILASETSNLWVEVFKVDSTSTESTWSVFAEDGQWLGDVVLPSRFTLYVIVHDLLIGVQRDELDVEYVALLSLKRPG